LRTGGGGEFNSSELEYFFKEHGIVHEVTAPYTPHHNGIMERRNRTILNMVRCMLKQKNLLHNFWGEAAMTATCDTLYPSHIYINKGIKIQILIKSIFKTFLNTSLSNG